MVIVNTQGIVLRAVKYKENDLILTIFSRKLGKISAIAKGARRTKSALLSSCQVFAYSNFTLKKQGNMYRVSQTEIIKSFYEISYKKQPDVPVESVKKEEADDGKYYRVQVGAYKTKQYAIDLAESLKKQGYPAIVKYY